jgi:hypothetical protein
VNVTEYATPGEFDVELATGGFRGKYLNVTYPETPLHLEDIATPLSKDCRYGGACKGFYSVAEHAVLVASKLRKIGAPVQMQMAGLHHDDAEFALRDIQRPVKLAKRWLLASWFKGLAHLSSPTDPDAHLTNLLDLAIWQSIAHDSESPEVGPLWRLEDLHASLLKDVDNWACRFEASQIMPSHGRNWENVWLKSGAVPIPTHDDDRILCLEWPQARAAYLDMHYQLALEMYCAAGVR